MKYLLIILISFFACTSGQDVVEPVCANTLTCKLACKNGFAIDEMGCEICQCYNPCAVVRCMAGYTCIATQPQCIRAPCPSIAQCIPICPSIKCRKFCINGYIIDENGCQTCKCK